MGRALVETITAAALKYNKPVTQLLTTQVLNRTSMITISHGMQDAMGPARARSRSPSSRKLVWLKHYMLRLRSTSSASLQLIVTLR